LTETISPTRDHFEVHAHAYAEHVAPRFAVTHDYLVETVLARDAWSVADVCCGDGRVAGRLPPTVGRRFVGVDRSRALVRMAERSSDSVAYVLGDAQALPLPDRCFDLVLCNLAILLTGRPMEVLAELLRVCAPGGQVVVSSIGDIRQVGAAAPARRSGLSRLIEYSGLDARTHLTLTSVQTFRDSRELALMLQGEVGAGTAAGPAAQPAPLQGPLELELLFDIYHIDVK
jgi:SAM-dependent methyltransferase